MIDDAPALRGRPGTGGPPEATGYGVAHDAARVVTESQTPVRGMMAIAAVTPDDAMTPKELEQRQRFATVYDRSQEPVMLSIERSVCGCDYGGNSWTTKGEADRIGSRLGLAAGVRLLDLGAGSGWPALYLAQKHRCHAVLVDLPENGLRIARQRAARDGLAGRVGSIVADAADLPLADRRFDAITHCDLLCCLERKQSVLAECRRVIRSRGRMAFTVISIAAGLSSEQRRRAIANGPGFLESDADYSSLLCLTGWAITGRANLTRAYGASCARQLRADKRHESRLAALVGHFEYAERAAGWSEKLAAIRDGLLVRELYVVAPKSG